MTLKGCLDEIQVSGRNALKTNGQIVKPYKFHHSSDEIIGEHNGAHFFTIGQRKGMNVGGQKEPLFVIGQMLKKILSIPGKDKTHPGLNRKGLFIKRRRYTG